MGFLVSLFPFEGPLLVGLYGVFFRSSINCFYSSKKKKKKKFMFFFPVYFREFLAKF